MFENLRDKFLNVQHDLSASFRNLATGEGQINKGKKQHISDVSYNAGAGLLHHYQTQWEEMHKNNASNAVLGQEADTIIGSLHSHCYEHLSIIRTLNIQLASLPQLQTGILDLMGKIGELEGLFEEVEDALINLEDVIEIQELQERQLDHRFQLAMYKEKKLADYENMRTKLNEEHTNRISEYEKKHNAVLRERQTVFQEAFEEVLHQYKTSGLKQIQRDFHQNANSTVSLEEIDLNDDVSALNDFLDDGSENKAEKPLKNDESRSLNANETVSLETDVTMHDQSAE